MSDVSFDMREREDQAPKIKTIRRTSQFKRDVRTLQRRGETMDCLRHVLESLIRGEELPSVYRDHVLVGQYRGTRECHLGPDWLLIYERSEREVVLIRTGSHSDLFK